jgi:lysophospholipase L1-like esterase
MNNQNDRRSFLKKAALASMVSVAPFELLARSNSTVQRKVPLKQDDIILFQGDSITDAGRKKDQQGSNSSGVLGTGYVTLAAAAILKHSAGKNINIFNKGISGNKVYQLADRWEEDCLQIKPTVLSILIGVNDFWHAIDGKYAGTIEIYRKDLTALLSRTKEKLPDVKLIIGEPFAIIGVKSVTEKWYPAFNEYRAVAKEISENFKAAFIPYQSIFDQAQKVAPGAYWTADGVHPSLAGCQLMADAWLDSVKQG